MSNNGNAGVQANTRQPGARAAGSHADLSTATEHGTAHVGCITLASKGQASAAEMCHQSTCPPT